MWHHTPQWCRKHSEFPPWHSGVHKSSLVMTMSVKTRLMSYTSMWWILYFCTPFVTIYWIYIIHMPGIDVLFRLAFLLVNVNVYIFLIERCTYKCIFYVNSSVQVCFVSMWLELDRYKWYSYTAVSPWSWAPCISPEADTTSLWSNPTISSVWLYVYRQREDMIYNWTFSDTLN